MTAARHPPDTGNDDAQAAGVALGIRGQTATNRRDSAAASDEVQADKQFDTLAAEAALSRCSLYRLADGRYLLTRQSWGMSRELETLDAVERVLRAMRGQA